MKSNGAMHFKNKYSVRASDYKYISARVYAC